MEFPWHSGKVLEQLDRQRKQGLLCDCTFVVDGVDFKAHKAVLAACSAYFHSLFLDQEDVVHVDISNAAGLGQVLDFMYTAKLNLSPQNVEDVLAVANILQIQEIVNACSAYQSMSNTAASLDFTVGESSLNTEQQEMSHGEQHHQAEADSFSSTEEDFMCEMTPEQQSFKDVKDEEEEQETEAFSFTEEDFVYEMTPEQQAFKEVKTEEEEQEQKAEADEFQGKSPSRMDQSALGSNPQITDIKIKISSNSAHRRIYDKRNVCLYCEKPFAKLTRHLKQKHSDKAEVAKALDPRQGSAMRDLLLSKIRNMGNYNHNCSVLSSGKGQLIPKRQATYKTTATDYVPCKFCCAMYLKAELWRHYKHCKLHVEKNWPLKRKVHASCSVMLPTDATVSNGLKNVLEEMTYDSVTDLVKSDALIISLGERMFLKNREVGRQRADIRNKMRALARLVLMARTIDQDIVYLRDLINPGKFNTVLEAVKRMTGFNELTNRFATPSTALKLRQSLVKVTHILQGEALQQDDGALKGRAEQFHELIELEWKTRVSVEDAIPKEMELSVDVASS